MIKVLEQESKLKSGAANLNVLRVDINQTTNPELRDLWITTKQKTDPLPPAAVARSLKGKGHPGVQKKNVRRGSMSSAPEPLTNYLAIVASRTCVSHLPPSRNVMMV